MLVMADFSAFAQDYPNKPVRILVPYSPGGSTDITARILAAKLTDKWHQQVVVENKPGGNGFIAMTAGAKAAPDGYTLILATTGEVAINPYLFKEVPFNMERDFAPITLVGDGAAVLAANANAPYKNVADVITAAKAKPGTIPVASAGTGTSVHITIEWIALATGTKFQHIPYKGGAPAGAALAGGDVPLGVIAASGASPYVKSGKVRILAVTSTKRSPLLPDVASLQEAGVKDIDSSTWSALFAPKGTPPEIIAKINADLTGILKMPDVVERFTAAGLEAIPSTSEGLNTRVKTDSQRYKDVIEKADIKTD